MSLDALSVRSPASFIDIPAAQANAFQILFCVSSGFAAELGNTTHVVGDTAPVVGDTASVVGDTASVVSETASVVSETAPVVGETAPAVGETAPAVGETATMAAPVSPPSKLGCGAATHAAPSAEAFSNGFMGL